MANKAIPDKIKEQVKTTVVTYNQELNNDNLYFVHEFRGRFLYLKRYTWGILEPICRLTFCGEMDNWEFAIYKHSSETYDPDEWFFPGSELVNGTVRGAMEAGMKTYRP
jgi:hypothetical protein